MEKDADKPTTFDWELRMRITFKVVDFDNERQGLNAGVVEIRSPWQHADQILAGKQGGMGALR